MTFEIAKGREIFRWGPIPLVLTYACTFFQAFTKKELEQYGFYWHDAVLLLRDKTFIFIQDAEELKVSGAEMFQKHVMTPAYIEDKARAQSAAMRVHEYYHSFSPSRLQAMSDAEFVEEMGKFNRLLIDFQIPTIAAEMGNYGSISFLETALKTYVPNETALKDAILALTSSEQDSFFLQEERDLQRATDIKKHRNEYFWLRNSYASVEDLPETFFEERKRNLPFDLEVVHEKRVTEVRKHKREMVNQYRLPAGVIFIADRIVDAMEFQDERKKEILVSLHYMDMFLTEAEHRISPHGNRYMFDELIDIASGARPDARTETFGYLLQNGSLHEIGAQETTRYWDLYAKEILITDMPEIRGIVASRGQKISGKVKIILDPMSQGAREFIDGEILVTTMTSPEYVFLMKKASAIVTDTGGLTSHAAIVSRELKKPCIIGTKYATQILKDGDMVEVDAEKGIVRKL